jgi:hypothetical protein
MVVGVRPSTPSMGALKLRLPSPSCFLRFSLLHLLFDRQCIDVGVTCTFPCTFPLTFSLSTVAAGCITTIRPRFVFLCNVRFRLRPARAASWIGPLARTN